MTDIQLLDVYQAPNYSYQLVAVCQLGYIQLFAENQAPDICLLSAVVDPGCSWAGANSQSRGANLLICTIFAETCMKMKEFGPQKFPGAPLWIRQWSVQHVPDVQLVAVYEAGISKLIQP